MNENFRNRLNALNIFQLAYYWPACGSYICLSIGEKNSLIAGLVKTISIS